MYKYYTCLSKPSDFKTLTTTSKKKQHFLYPSASIINLNDDIIKDIKQLFIDFKTIDYYMGEFSYINTNDEKMQSEILELCQVRDEEKRYLEFIKKKINFNAYDLLSTFLIYKRFLDYLINIYEDKKELFLNILKRLKRMILYAEALNWIEIPSFSYKEIIWPNNWYITPNGYLYNACLNGENRGLIYDDYYDIYNILKCGKHVNKKLYRKIQSIKRKINDIELKGYVTFDELRPYYKFAFSPDEIYNIEPTNWEKIVGRKYYSKELSLIALGYLNALLSIYEKSLKFYNEIRNSSNYNELIKCVIPRRSCESIEKMLVEFYGFHRIVVFDENKMIITTSSISEFSEYIKNGWNVVNVNKISYDKEADCLVPNGYEDYLGSPHISYNGLSLKQKNKRLIFKPINEDDLPF